MSAAAESLGTLQALELRLREFLPEDALLSKPESMRPYETDGLTAYRQVPGLVAIPRTREQVRDVLVACREAGVPVIARGAGTGLSGGALPRPDALVLSLARFDNILSVDPENQVAVVEPGVRNLAISEAVAPHGLFYAPDPSSQIACSIGGNVAENSGGVHCLKYGLTVNNVLGLKAFTLDGDLLELGGPFLDAPGYDLLALLNGSEGLLAVIVEVTVRLVPKPERITVLLADFESVDAAGNAVAAVIESGLLPAGLEMMDSLAIKASEDFAKAGYPTDAAAILLCELDGSETEVAEQTELASEVFRSHGARDVRVAADAEERARFWAGRKSAFPAMGRIAPDYYCMDGTIPRRHLTDVLQRISARSAHYDLPVANVFHAGDGNLHPLILYDANKPGDLEKAERLGGEILEMCIAVGGTVTGEHGVGTEKLNQMCSQFSPRELEVFHALKAAFDPDGLLNPGKAVPTLARCSELGGMHVHGGELPFPHLERL